VPRYRAGGAQAPKGAALPGVHGKITSSSRPVRRARVIAMLGSSQGSFLREAILKDISTIDPMMDDIGAMIDEALAKPELAEAMKVKIRDRLSRRARPEAAPELSSDEDPEDFWENVPI